MNAGSDPIRLLRLANPVPPGSLRETAAERVDDLLVWLRANEVEAAVLSIPRRRWRPLLLAAVVAAALALVGVAIAAGLGAFNGISAAQRPQTPADRIDPKLLAEINAHNPARVGKLLPNSARLVKEVSGARIYVVATKNGQLCVLAQRKIGGAGMGCGSHLTQNQPTTAASFNSKPGDRAAPTISWGITVDGVTAVSFIAGGKKVTVPVVHNVWVYESHTTGVLESLTVRWADGSTKTVP